MSRLVTFLETQSPDPILNSVLRSEHDTLRYGWVTVAGGWDTKQPCEAGDKRGEFDREAGCEEEEEDKAARTHALWPRWRWRIRKPFHGIHQIVK